MAKEPQMQITDETLMALADGELSSDVAERVMAAVEADSELQARLRRFTETRRLLREEAARPQPSPRDAALIARITAATQTKPAPPEEQRGSAPANLNRRPLAALAAAMAAAVIGLGWWWGYGGPESSLPKAHLTALDSLMSGESSELPDGQDLTMIASYRTGAGELCREFETHSGTEMTVVVACREGEGWSQRFATDIEAAEGYVPASGDLEALDKFLAETEAGAPLTPAEETTALAE
ncbi:Anti sigma-E protein RseA, N-terminal domain [Paracoccus saliphilus]|uniref:Anti sigma-E protein RseA, N-terminal domain n=2 Tax=Paracoccus saliphilus TaxID=405559 RepID=A0AA45W1C8_9RHOB|nr:Anti sigma-E protein RseA, N-terminal domain [Paracoccus saliphilus]